MTHIFSAALWIFDCFCCTDCFLKRRLFYAPNSFIFKEVLFQQKKSKLKLKYGDEKNFDKIDRFCTK